MNPEPRLYYISDTAYNRLITLAQQARYVPYGSNKVIGLSAFLNDLASCPFRDTRPPLVKQRHEQEIALNHAPTWTSVKFRRTRTLKLTDDAIARYYLMSHRVGITRKEPYVRGEPSRISPYPAIGFVLEGIGLQWLTPTELPDKTG
jgi:hypothetical protein